MDFGSYQAPNQGLTRSFRGSAIAHASFGRRRGIAHCSPLTTPFSRGNTAARRLYEQGQHETRGFDVRGTVRACAGDRADVGGDLMDFRHPQPKSDETHAEYLQRSHEEINVVTLGLVMISIILAGIYFL